MSFQSESRRFLFNQLARCQEIEPHYPEIAMEMEGDTRLHEDEQRRNYNAKHGAMACGSFLICLLLLWGVKPMSQPTQKQSEFDSLIRSADLCITKSDFNDAHIFISDARDIADSDGQKAVIVHRWGILRDARKAAKNASMQ